MDEIACPYRPGRGGQKQVYPRVIKEGSSACEEGLPGSGGIFLTEQILVSRAVCGYAPSPPAHLLFSKANALHHLPFVGSPHCPRLHASSVARLFEPGHKNGSEAVAPRLGIFPEVLEFPKPVGGGLIDNAAVAIVGHRLHNGNMGLLEVWPEGHLGAMDIGKGEAAARPLASRGDAADSASKPRLSARRLRITAGVSEIKLLRVAGLAHRLQLRGKGLIKELVHLEKVSAGLVVMSHNKGAGISRGGAVGEKQALNKGGKAHLSALEKHDSHPFALLMLLSDYVVKFLLSRIESKRDNSALLIPYFQEVFAIGFRLAYVCQVPPLPSAGRAFAAFLCLRLRRRGSLCILYLPFSLLFSYSLPLEGKVLPKEADEVVFGGT